MKCYYITKGKHIKNANVIVQIFHLHSKKHFYNHPVIAMFNVLYELPAYPNINNNVFFQPEL